MIPPREQRLIQQRFEQELRGRVRLDYFTQKPSAIVVPGRTECRSCAQVGEVVNDLASLHPRVALTVHEFADARDEATRLGVERVPCVVVRGQANRPIRFYGVPGGTQFANLIETMIIATHAEVTADPQALARLRRLREPVQASVFVTIACRYSPAVANTACRLALASASVRVDIIDLGEYPEMAGRYGVRATPTVVFDGRHGVQGALDDVAFAEHALKSRRAPALVAPVEAGPATPFDASTAAPPADAAPAQPRIYVPGR